MSLLAHDQRVLIEELLGITELSRKAELLKEITKYTKDQIKEEEYTLKAAEDTNARILKSIKDIERRQRVWTNKQTSDLVSLEAGVSALSHVDIESELKNHSLLTTYTGKIASIKQANT